MAISSPAWWTTPEPIHAYNLSLVSVVITSFAALIGLLAYAPTGSSLVLCWGLENLVDLFSSLVVLWRFFNPGDTHERVLLLKKREKRASVAISFILFALGIGIVVSAIFDFKEAEEASIDFNQDLLIIMSLVFTVVFFILTIIKLQMSVLLDSRALLKDGYCSLFGTILACSLFLNTIIVASIPMLWWLDPIISLIVGIASLFIGLRSVLIQSYEKKIPIWNPKWWIFSQGDVSVQEMTKMDEANPYASSPASTPPPILYDDLGEGRKSESTSAPSKDIGSNRKTVKNNDGFIDLSLDGSAENGVRQTEMTTRNEFQIDDKNENSGTEIV